jgi:hypothetical protein
VFTDRPFGGNPLAVFPRVMDLATATMQAIARELNLSESSLLDHLDGRDPIALALGAHAGSRPFHLERQSLTLPEHMACKEKPDT